MQHVRRLNRLVLLQCLQQQPGRWVLTTDKAGKEVVPSFADIVRPFHAAANWPQAWTLSTRETAAAIGEHVRSGQRCRTYFMASKSNFAHSAARLNFALNICGSNGTQNSHPRLNTSRAVVS